MKILFIATGQETLAIEYLSASLKKAGHTVRLLFLPDLDGSMGFLRHSFLENFLTEDFIIKGIRKIDPDLIALSSPLNIYPFVKKTARLIKKNFTVPIIAGGGHPTLAPQHILKNSDIDMLCIGEGDECLVELADLMERDRDYSRIPNLGFRKDAEIVVNPVRPLNEDLDSLPFPDRELFYQYGCFAGNIYFVAGRGCPFGCTYCCQHAFRSLYKGKGKYVRFRSIENIIRELEECLQKYNVERIHSEDDLFATDEGWLNDFCDAYRERINIPLYCHYRPGTLSDHMIKKLKDAGCKVMYLGIDSGNAQVREHTLNRKVSDEVMLAQAKLIKTYNLELACPSMYGLPGETSEQMLDTFNMLKKIEADYVYATIYYPFYGTELYDLSLKKGYLKEATACRIMEGEGSPYQYPLLENSQNALAMILKNTVPVYMRFRILRPLIDLIIRHKLLKLSSLVNLLFTPFAYGHLGKIKRKEILKTIVVFLLYRFGIKSLKA